MNTDTTKHTSHVAPELPGLEDTIFLSFPPSLLPLFPHLSRCIPDMPQGDGGGLQDRQTKTHNTHNALTMPLAAAIVCVHWGKGLGACIPKEDTNPGTHLPFLSFYSVTWEHWMDCYKQFLPPFKATPFWTCRLTINHNTVTGTVI